MNDHKSLRFASRAYAPRQRRRCPINLANENLWLGALVAAFVVMLLVQAAGLL